MAIDTTAAPATAPVERVTPIKPSEAMRLGCLTTRQMFGDYGEEGQACALGAMAVGYGRAARDAFVYIATWSDSPVSRAVHIGGPCPALGCTVTGGGAEGGTRIIAHLNDDHRWSRERIADWLEGLGL